MPDTCTWLSPPCMAKLMFFVSFFFLFFFSFLSSLAVFWLLDHLVLVRHSL